MERDYEVALNWQGMLDDEVYDCFDDYHVARKDIRNQISSGDYYPSDCFPAAFLVCPGNDALKETAFSRLLKTVLVAEPGYPQDLWIPFDPEERRKKFHTAFQELEGYLRAAETDRILSYRPVENTDPLWEDDWFLEWEQKMVLNDIRNTTLRIQSEAKQKAEQESLLKIYSPVIVAAYEKLKQATLTEQVEIAAYLHVRAAVAHTLRIPLEEVPEEIVNRAGRILTEAFLPLLESQGFVERADISLEKLIEFLGEEVNMLEDELDDLPLEFRNEFIEILEELRQLRDRT